MNKPLRVLSLGWGVQSWTLAAMIALKELPPIDVAVHADTTFESSRTYSHAARWTPWLEEHGVRVVTVTPERPNVINKWGGVMIPAYHLAPDGSGGPNSRQCTTHWKIAPIRKYVRSLLPTNPRPNDIKMLMGISWDEALRMKSSNVKYITHEYPLVDRRVRRIDCISWLEQNNLEVPPKSACVFCPYHPVKGWQELKRRGGSDWETAVLVDAEIRTPKNNAPMRDKLFVHAYRKPLAEAISIPEDEGAQQMMLGENDPTCDSGFCFA